ncbi:formylglycine-generating enzyme family protein [Ruegeria sp. EL01]|jgi:formylglycine-generating enzyme required for sulfatase activity|uniref:formylglycine-generating enzyme family protein n=1 Tax=Ruegeria sp. EL01 TaxID=2107578 RepID=UPI000EA8373C|nr:formylglycine-generating enzyme family protein [Ruegeria sp. EL01]
MYNPLAILGLVFFLIVGDVASAEEVYVTANGERVNALDVFQDCDVCPDLIVLPLGEFQMGSTVREANAARLSSYLTTNRDPTDYELKLRQSFSNLGIDPDRPEEGLRRYYAGGDVVQQDDPQYSVNPFLHEVPPHQVTIDLPIAMGRNEVTREEWTACVEDGGCEMGQKDLPRSSYSSCNSAFDCVSNPDTRVRFRLPNGPHATHPRSPMTGMTYYEMNDYTSWLNKKVGANVYRVPTEAEWEYAARAGTTTRYAQGDSLTLEQANFSVYRIEVVDGERVWKHDFGSARELLSVDNLDAANDWGLRHMSGNAGEFSSSCGEGPHRGLKTSSQYLAVDADRPDCKRSVKGGGYAGIAELARPARRVAISSNHWSPWTGFRVVRDLTLEQ